MSSALYSVTIDYLDFGHLDVPPITHPNIPDNIIVWDGVMAIVHTAEYALWTEGEIASDAMVQAFKGDFSMLEQEVEESPLAAVAFRNSRAVGPNVVDFHPIGRGSFCSRDELTVTVSPERSYVTIFMKMSKTDDWFTGKTLNLYTGEVFVAASRQTSYALDLGISSRIGIQPTQQAELLSSPEPVRSYLTSFSNASVWGNRTFSHPCGEDMFPLARFYFTKLEPTQEYPDLRVACAILGSISFIRVTALAALGLRHIGCFRQSGKDTAR